MDNQFGTTLMDLTHDSNCDMEAEFFGGSGGAGGCGGSGGCGGGGGCNGGSGGCGGSGGNAINQVEREG